MKISATYLIAAQFAALGLGYVLRAPDSELPSTIAEASSSELEPEPELEISTLESPNQEPTLEEQLLGIDLDTLQLRPARKICSRLGIQQKVNSKDAPLSWLRAQIKAKLSEKPTEVVPVIQEVLLAS
jgi:hypothetical protein